MHVQGHAACPPQPSGMDPAHRVEQVRGIHNVVVVVVGVVVVVVVVVVSQTPPAPHTPEQQSVPIAGGKQPWSPSGIQLTHIPTVVSQMDMEQLPHEPPQPLSPQFLFAQFGVQPHWLETPPPPQVLNPVQVLPQLSVKPVQSPSGIVPQSTPARQVVGVQQVPKSGFAFPGGEAGFMQLRLQQLMFVWHCLPSGLQPPSARATRGPMVSAARSARANTAAVTRAIFIVFSLVT